MISEIIKVKNLSVCYGDTSILENINFSIYNGEFIGIIGKSGVGKTSLLNAIAGFINNYLEKNSMIIIGNNTIFPHETNRYSKRYKLGFCFQNHNLFYWMTVAKNIETGLWNLSRNIKKERVECILKKIGLLEHANKYPNELSGGQKQRVALARALAYEPDVLLLDEPFSNLDIHTRDQMIQWVSDFISGYKTTVLMVSHYTDEVLLLANRVFILKEKKLYREIEVIFPKNNLNISRFSNTFQREKENIINILDS